MKNLDNRSGDALDNADDFSGDERAEDRFAGNELDEDQDFAGDDINYSDTAGNQPAAQNYGKPVESTGGKSLQLLWWVGALFVPISVLVLGWSVGKNFFPQKQQPRTKTLTVVEDQLTTFSSFVIPFSGSAEFSYIYLSVSLNLMDRELKAEVKEKQNLLRGSIYDLLKQQTDQAGWFPSPEQLKKLIRQAININLSKGKVSELYITQYLVM